MESSYAMKELSVFWITAKNVCNLMIPEQIPAPE
jgi:hypothetical protein